jgi:hypothetical protein
MCSVAPEEPCSGSVHMCTAALGKAIAAPQLAYSVGVPDRGVTVKLVAAPPLCDFRSKYSAAPGAAEPV